MNGDAVRTAILQDCISTWGRDAQMNMAIEEMSELIKEICKNKRGGTNRALILDEITDVTICLDQLIIMFGFTEDELYSRSQYKLTRVSNRLREWKEDKP